MILYCWPKPGAIIHDVAYVSGSKLVMRRLHMTDYYGSIREWDGDNCR